MYRVCYSLIKLMSTAAWPAAREVINPYKSQCLSNKQQCVTIIITTSNTHNVLLIDSKTKSCRPTHRSSPPTHTRIG